GRVAVCVLLIAPVLGAGQVVAEPRGGDPGVRVPGFWDPRRRPEKPDLSRISVIRFLTETDYPPFNFAGPDGNPQRFNVDLARLLCEELKVACTIQMRRFETLIAALNGNQAMPQLLLSRRPWTCVPRSISPIPITARRHVSWPSATPRSMIRCLSG